MITSVRRMDEIWTEDEYKLGVACSLYYRPADEIDLKNELFPVYLGIKSYELGDTFFVPTPHLAERDDESGRVWLDTTMKGVLGRTWSRMPDFVAKRQGRRVELSDDELTPLVTEENPPL